MVNYYRPTYLANHVLNISKFTNMDLGLTIEEKSYIVLSMHMYEFLQNINVLAGKLFYNGMIRPKDIYSYGLENNIIHPFQVDKVSHT